MSLITIRSSTQDNGANVYESAAYMTNNFKRGIKLHPGNTLELVSMSINKLDKFEIIQGDNDQFIWRIGAGAASSPPFQQHVITVPPGSYNGGELATTIAQLCNTSTFLDLYKDQWTCTFAQGTADSNASFTLNYGQRATPGDNFKDQTLALISNPTNRGLAPTFADEGNNTKIAFPRSTYQMDSLTTATHLFQGDRGIFGNDGQVTFQSTPFRTVQTINLTSATNEFGNWRDFGSDKQGTFTALSPAVNGYELRLDISSGAYFGVLDRQGTLSLNDATSKLWYDMVSANPWTNSFGGAPSTDTFDTTGAAAGGYTFRRNKGDGTGTTFFVPNATVLHRWDEHTSLPIQGPPADNFSLTSPGVYTSATYASTITSTSWTGGTVPALQTNIAAPDPDTADERYLYNPDTDTFDWDQGTDATRTLKLTAPPHTYTPVYQEDYGHCGIGWVRDQLVTGRTLYPGDTNATFSLNVAECDLVFEMTSNAGLNDVEVRLYQMNNTGSQNYPIPGWRTSKTVFSTRSGDWKTDLPASTPASWASFTYGTDHVQMKVIVTGIRTLSITIAHDTAGDGTYIEEVTLIKTAQPGMGGKSLTKNIREVFYPLRPIIMCSRGSAIDGREIIITGKCDTQTITQANSVLRDDDGTAPELHEDGDPTEQVGDGTDPANATKVSALFKFGTVNAEDVVDASPGQDQIVSRDVQPNTASINLVLGFPNIANCPSGNATNATATPSGTVPYTSISEPSLHVELPDFNIQSWSGESGDSGKAIAVIPREQWTTDSKKGTLHWQAQYPQPIDLNLAETQTFYQLTARVREPSGELVKDLINPTELCLKIGETAESRQQRVMDKAIEKMAMVVGNAQDRKISSAMTGLPRV